ncbi:glycosyltransferase [Luteipulveratus flavus]|uniref:D-inositol 3-phosphate glycosyltransferase n=1 Tax=Luteipulveratus flavus TaxID=3031728 RepID=A0ABT6C9V8_9MICO|nr:glycosyltransferase [Luteipulveratus sp. YIM 133296]MDF8265585.1 glycosyltransferase [Luteipulveratus sp. YIM 133296]
MQGTLRSPGPITLVAVILGPATDPVRVAQLANFIGPVSGGMKIVVDRLGAAYHRAGIERLLIIPGAEDAREETAAGTVVQIRAPRVRGDYRLIVQPWRVIEVLEEFAPTSLEISDKSTLLPIARWARRAGVPTVLFSHERMGAMLALRTGRPSSVAAPISLLNRILLRQFDTVVVTSEYAAAEFERVPGPRTAGLVRVPLGVDLKTFAPRERAPYAGPLRLVHAGRLSREKSPHLAVATAVELHRRGVPVRLDVLGGGPHRDELEALAGDAPVVFHGHISDRAEVAERLATADISLSVCPCETFGLAVLEALACGTPVVTADTGGARELIDGTCGSWAAPDPSSLADAVERLASRSVGATRTSARARAEQFTWKRTERTMVDLHREITEPAVVPA